MGFRSLRFYNFRNIEDGLVSVDAPEVFLIGENGQGKTNLVEAVYLLSFGSSFRTRKDEHFYRHGQTEMALEGKFSCSAEEDETEILIRGTGKQKDIRLDGKMIKDRREIIGKFPCIVFCHEDIGYITGTPDRQRIFFNQTLGLKDPFFLDILKRYTKALKQRNTAIKDKNWGVAGLFDEELIKTGLDISLMRRELTEEFSLFFARLYREISGLEAAVKIRYVPSWQREDFGGVEEFLRKKRDTDSFFCTTTTGPHRDRFRFYFDGRDFTAAASTGQIRLASLILKTAQAAFFLNRSGRKPILLLDDVLLEMDPVKRKRFIAQFPPYEQAFFTFLPDEQFPAYKKSDTLVYMVRSGRFCVNG
ncbi:MAG: DNA replication and repair protein RecF [Spirochaetales bacterium]|jgi:DNA replication and repair protein RecF|nr:DNA replication and repair protein RecF [Spirochaetales bacterium]